MQAVETADRPRGSGSRVRGDRRAERMVGWSCSAVLLGLLLVHSLLAPAFRGPDEPQHFDLAREWSHDAEYDVVSRQLSTQVERSLGLVHFGRRSQHLEQAEAPAREDRPRFDQLGADEASRSYNQISQHGPLYTVVIGTAVAAIDAVEPGPRWAFDRELAVVRILSVLLVVPVPYLVFRSARELGASVFAGWLGGLVPSVIPQFTHINALANNDAMIVLLSAGVMLVCARLLRRGASRGDLMSLGALLGLGFMTKGFIVGAAAAGSWTLALVWKRAGVPWRQVMRDSATLGSAAIVAGGWWMLRNVAEFGTPQPKGERMLPPAPEGFDPDPWTWFGVYRLALPRSFVGKFGWLELPLAWHWVYAVLSVLLVGSVLGLCRSLVARSARELRPIAGWESVVFIAPVAVLLGVSVVNSYRGYASTSLFPAIQGRYIFGAIPFAAVLIGTGYAWLRRPRRRLVVGAAAVLLLLAVQWAAATTILEYYWGPEAGSLRDQVAALLSWSPWPRLVSVAFAAAFGLAVVWTAASGWNAARWPEETSLTQSGS